MPFTVSGRLNEFTAGNYALRPAQRRFSLSFSQEAGWDQPDSIVLTAMRALAEDVTSVIHYPIPQHTGRITPVFEDAPGETWVTSTVGAFIWMVADDVKWEMTDPIGESYVFDPLVVY
jgi:hypothetical protein